MRNLFRTLWGMLGPRRKGRWVLGGLVDNVEVLSDRMGVPHVYAGSVPDLFYVQGYLHARERAFQMDLQRRIGQGRLAEVLGPAALPADRFLRKLGLWQRTLRLWPEIDRRVQSWLMTYAKGVNAGLNRMRPLENWLLGSKIEPWTGLHSLLWTQVMAFDMGSNWESEWVRSRLLQEVGSEGARRFHLEHPEDFPAAAGSHCGTALAGLWADYQAARSVLDEWTSWGGGSNAWAVSPRLSKSGSALLAADPHVLAKVPSTWYEVHLECPELSLYGASLPGVPGIVMGHNRQVAWGMTNSYVDTQDLVLERLRGDEVERPQGWVPLRLREERIRVRGKADHLELVKESEAGPLLFEDREGTGISLRWTGFEGPDHTLQAWFDLLAVGSVAEARTTLERWNNPVLNFVLADQQGNIGYQLAGKVPIRQGSFGVVPQGGWEARGQWTGFVERSQLPGCINPECGYVVSANHAPKPLDELPFLGVDFCDGYRAQRISDWLQAQPQHDLAGFAQLQVDTLSLAAQHFIRLLRREGPEGWESPDLLGEMLTWNGDLASDSRPAALYQIWLFELLKAAYQPVLPGRLFLYWCGAPVSTLGVLGGHAGRYISFLLDAWENREELDWSRLVQESWLATLAEARKRLGLNPAHWRWGRLHRFQPCHPLSSVPGLASLLNPPAMEMGGDVTTVLQSTVLPQDPFVVKGWVPSYRLLVELGPQLQSFSVLPTGQSGWVGDRMNFNQQELYARGQHHPSLIERGDLEGARPHRLTLHAAWKKK